MSFYVILFSAIFYFAPGTTANITSSTNESTVRSTITSGNASKIPNKNTPCLNQSYYNTEITSSCLSHTPTDTDYCNYMWSLVKCLKNRVENSSGVQCSPQIQLKSIALQNRNTIEMLTRKSISECIVPPCVERLTSVDGMTNIITPCYQQNQGTFSAICRLTQRAIHCAIAMVNYNSNSTCVAADKMHLAQTICISDFQSEFSQQRENTTVLVGNTDQDPTASSDHIIVILSIGLVLTLIAIIFIGVGLFKMRAKKLRKTARRLPSIAKTGEHPYEIKLHYPEETSYVDPDYQTIEEINDGYQHLGGYNIEDDSEEKSDDTGSYVQPNDVHVVATITDEDGDDKHHSYLQIIECPEKSSFTNNECTNFTELTSTKCNNENMIGQERKRESEITREVSDINQQETATLTDDNNSKENYDVEIVVNTVSFVSVVDTADD
ncbi:uncharacterized protein LOC125673360 isoform X2 [Ostrea edulis]|uniref:uncharacterized protein LOC125673360 isoform X2 n=1 Tax=Ostrea edulis TaxID=37623 RepID=UPI0024AEB3B9|nr:uncharacterized protein LOC125673360 isoform X2 [Ostrea edulis]